MRRDFRSQRALHVRSRISPFCGKLGLASFDLSERLSVKFHSRRNFMRLWRESNP